MDTKKVRITRTTVLRGNEVLAVIDGEIVSTLAERRASMKQRYGQNVRVYCTYAE